MATGTRIPETLGSGPGEQPDGHPNGGGRVTRRALLTTVGAVTVAEATDQVLNKGKITAALWNLVTGRGRSTAPQSSATRTPQIGQAPETTPTPSPDSPLSHWQDHLRQQFEQGVRTVTIDASTFPAGSKVLLEAHGAPSHAATSIYRVQNHPGDEVSYQALSLIDWTNRSNPPLPIIVPEGMNVIPAMAQAYGGTQEAQQQIESGRPVTIKHLTAEIIHITGVVTNQNGKDVVQPADIMALQLTPNANLSAGPAQL